MQVSAGLRDLMNRCFNQDPFKRITIDQIIVHPWMQCTEPDAVVAKQQYIAEMAIRQRLVSVCTAYSFHSPLLNSR